MVFKFKRKKEKRGQKVDFRDKFVVHYVGTGNYLLVSKSVIRYNNINFNICINLMDRMNQTKCIRDIGTYTLNIGLVPQTKHIKASILREVLEARIKDIEDVETIMSNKDLLHICINSYDLFNYGLVLPLISPLTLALTNKDIEELEGGKRSILDTTTISKSLTSASSLMDYYKMRHKTIIKDLDHDIKEYVFSKLDY